MNQSGFVWILTALFFLGTIPTRAELPARVAIELGDVRVQSLPAAVSEVKRGPDGKIWLFFDPPEQWSLAQAKAVVEREFDQPSPQIIGLELLGWGRDGRAWFIPQGWTPEGKDQRLLGYDGEGWIEHDNKANVVAGPLVLEAYELFLGRSGVAVRSGEGWQTALPLNGSRPAGLMVAEPGGVSAVIQVGSDNAVYRFRDGQMVQINDGSTIKGEVLGLASCRFGVFGYVDQKLVLLAPPADRAGFAALTDRLQPLIEQLERAEPADRGPIMQSILELGPAAIEPIKRRIDQIEDPEVRLVLRRIVLGLEQADPPAAQPEPEGQRPGASIAWFRLTSISFVHQLKRGHVLIGVREGHDLAQDAALQPGLLVIPPAGEPYYIADELVNNSGLQHELYSTPIKPPDLVLPMSEHVVRLPGHSGTRIWRSGSGTKTWQANPALLLDLEKQTLNADNAEVLLAVDEAGRRYTAQGDWAGRYRYSSIEVITPGARDDRRFLDLPEAMSLDTRAYGMGGFARGAVVAMDSQGQLYALAKGRPLQRYDGEKWEQIPGTEQARATRLLLISPAGAVVFETGSVANLVWEQQVHEAPSLEALIEQHHELLSDLFKGGSLTMMMPDLGQIIADKAGNIWLRKAHDVSVFDGEQWIRDDDERVAQSGKRSRFRFMAAVGDGSSIYITNLIHDPPLAYYASVHNGAIRKADAPHGQPAHPTMREIRDASGTLWVANASRVGAFSEHQAVRIVPGEEPLRITGHGYPVLHDGGGMVVLYRAATLRPQDRKLSFVRDGEIVHSLAMPRLLHNTDLTSDRPGSIYAITDRGIAHLTANPPPEAADQPDQPDPPHHYAITAQYQIEAEGGSIRLFASARGYLAVVRDNGQELSLHILDLPLKPRPSLVEQLREQVKRLLDEHSGWGAKEPIHAKLKDHPPHVQVQVLIPFIDYLNGKEPAEQGNRVVVKHLGQLWEAALPEVLALLDDEQASRRAAAAAVVRDIWYSNQGLDHMPWMQSTGPKLAALLRDDPSTAVRIEAARALATFREQAAPYAGALTAALDDPEVEVRQVALSAMAQVGPDAWAAVPRLIQILEEPGELYRGAAAEALKSMGAAAKDAAPALTRMLADPTVVDGKIDASNGLYWISRHTRWQVDPKALAGAIRHGEYGGPAYVAYQFGIDDLQVVAALAESLDVSDEYESYTAMESARALIAIRTDNQTVLSYLHDLSQSNRPYASVWAAVVHANLIGDHAAAVPVPRSVLESSTDRDEQQAALLTLQFLGPDAAELLPLIKPDTGARNPWGPLYAIKATWTLAGKPDEHLAWVASELSHRSSSNYPDDAAAALGVLGPMADAQTPAIAAVLDEFVPHSRYNRWHAAMVLRGIGPTANTRAALPQLKRLLDRQVEPSAYNRRAAAEAIWSISREADLVALSLADTLDDRGYNFFETVAALQRMGPAAAAAIPRLEQATSDANPYFREAAANALRAIRADVANDPPDEQAFATWYQQLGDPDDQVALDALWRFVRAGAPAGEFLTRQTRMLTPHQREQIVQTLKNLTQAVDHPPRAEDPANPHEQIQQALEQHLNALFAGPNAVRVEANDQGLSVYLNLDARFHPHASLEDNRRHARALQALDLLGNENRDDTGQE